LNYVALPPAAASRPAEAAPPPVTETPIPVPQAEPVTEPQPVDVTPVPVTPATVEGTQQGAGSGTGLESGSGGGSGTGTGTGTGSNDGPGSGGDGGYIQPAVLRGLIIAPDCARGQFTVLFSVEADGRVSGVEVQPSPKESGCRRDFVTRMRQYKFYPAKTMDGRAVASKFSIKVEH
jgi:outer membrane biosynthesis protein TonB